MKLRLENKEDYFIVENLTRECFWNVYKPGCIEHLALHKIRNDPCFIPELDYILEEDNKIIGSIVYTKGILTKDDNNVTDILMFGPFCIHPEYQKKGYGKKLVEYTLDKAKNLGYPMVIITGDPNYYNKFGFVPAANYEIYYKGMSKEEPADFLMVKVLDENNIDDLKGIYNVPKCYEVTDDELLKFDKKFPYKKKEIKKGQINI
ncbi:MAG: N-acetyltransferase [Methanobacteriaceae archaeon]|nr:N-acetyltransferase [Methanobacteriaceae archaeon]